MNVSVRHTTNDPACDTLLMYEGHDCVGRIGEGEFLEMLGPKQQDQWFAGRNEFSLTENALRASCTKWFRR